MKEKLFILLLALLTLGKDVLGQASTTQAIGIDGAKVEAATAASVNNSLAGKLDTANGNKVMAGTKTGTVTRRGVARADTFSIAGTGTTTLDMSAWLTANGYTSMLLISAIPYRSPGSATNAAQITLNGYTGTSVTITPTVQNPATISILGINVLSGLPLVSPATASEVKVYLSFIAYAL